MKQKTSILLCLICLSLSTLTLEAKLRHPRWNDPSMDFYPVDPYLFDDERFLSDRNRNQAETVDINFNDDTAIADTDNAIKAIKELLTYKTALLLPSAPTDDERYNLFRLESKINNRIFSDALLDHTRLNCLAKAIGHNRKFMNPRSVLNPDEDVITLIKETDWIENEIPERIQKHIATQQEFLKAYMLKYGPTIDALCENHLSSSGD